MTTTVHVYHRVDAPEQWHEASGLTYLSAELRSALETLDRLDQLLEPTSNREHRLSELLEIRVVRLVNDTTREGLGSDRTTLGIAEARHSSPSLVGSTDAVQRTVSSPSSVAPASTGDGASSRSRKELA